MLTVLTVLTVLMLLMPLVPLVPLVLLMVLTVLTVLTAHPRTQRILRENISNQGGSMATKPENTPNELDYSSVSPEHDGRPYYTPPVGWQPSPSNEPLPSFEGVDRELFADAIRKQIAPNETFWRKNSLPTAKQQLIAEQANNGIALAEKLLAVVGKGSWPTLDDCIPKGTILDVVDKFFYEKTDLPREIPFYTTIQYVASLLLQQGVTIQKSKTQVLYPDLWTMLLVTSGGGKTMTLDAISNAMGGKLKMFPHADSYAKFFENLDANNKSFYLKDEFAKFIRAINKDPKMEGLQGCLLNVYSNSTVYRSTKSESESIEKPALTILGLTQIANVTSTISKAMIDDGFAQRFGYAFGEKDGRTRILDYVLDGLEEQVSPLWKKLIASPFHAVYQLDDVVSKTYSAGGEIIMGRADALGVTEDFSRRVLFRAFKYALVYHVLTGKTDQYLHAEDMANGICLCARELRDTSRLLDMFGLLKPPAPNPNAQSTNNAAASIASAPPINKKRPTKGQPLTYDEFVEKSKKKILEFAAKGEKTTTRKLGGYVKVEASVLEKILTDLSKDSTLAPHITLPKS